MQVKFCLLFLFLAFNAMPMRGFSVMQKPNFDSQGAQKPYLKKIKTSNRRKNARRKAMQQIFKH